MCLGNTGFGVIGDRNRWNASEVLKRMHVSAEPRFHLLIVGGFGPRIAACTKRGHEQRGLPRDTCEPVVHRNRRARPVDEHLLPGLVVLAQYHVEL